MILRNARVALGPTTARRLDIEIRKDRIVALHKSALHHSIDRRDAIDLSGQLILPGLINAHDHLAFNLFPLLGRPPYPNATAWAHDVYKPDESPVREHRSVPRSVRLQWGAIKNLISGVTTVAHHDPDPARFFGARFPINVVKAGWAHSLEFTPDIVKRFRETPGDWPFVLHLGEGTDASAEREIFALDAMKLVTGRTVIVHGVALSVNGLRLLKTRKASMITCPVSNLFTLSRTLKRSAFSAGVPIALGTDSAITATGDLLDALRAARAIWNLSQAKLYRMVTVDSAKILRLHDGQGEIREGGVADLLVIRDTGATPSAALLALTQPQLVIVRGRIRLSRKRLPSLDSLSIAGRGRVFIDAPLPDLYRETASRLGDEFKLAARRLRINTIR